MKCPHPATIRLLKGETSISQADGEYAKLDGKKDITTETLRISKEVKIEKLVLTITYETAFEVGDFFKRLPVDAAALAVASRFTGDLLPPLSVPGLGPN